MSDGILIDTALFNETAARFQAYSKKDAGEVLKTNVRGVVKTVISITPPRTGSGGSASAAVSHARGKIAKDLAGGSGNGVRGGRRIGIFSVLSDGLIDLAVDAGLGTEDSVRLWTTKDGRVYGVQHHLFRPNATQSELRAHHKRYFKNGQMSRAGSYSVDIARWKWIAKMVIRQSTFEAYLNSESRKIGFYARGWVPAASELGVAMPAYMKKPPAAPGFVTIQLEGDRLFIEIANEVGYSAAFMSDVRRRFQWAVNVQAAKMERQIPHLIRAAGRRAGVDINA